MDMSTLDFNYFDAVIASIVVILGIKGMINGFVKEFFGLVGLIGGVYVAAHTAAAAGALIDKNLYHMESATASQLAGFIVVLALVWIAAIAIGSLFSSLTQASGLGPLNRLFGFIAGGGKYFLIFALIVTALSHVTLVKENLQKYVDDSVLYPYLLDAGSFLINLNPEDFQSAEGNTTAASGAVSARSLLKERNSSSSEQNSSLN